MAISETMSNSTDWMHIYQHNLSGQSQNTPSFNGSVSESVTVSATAGATAAQQSNLSPSYSNLNMEGGRVSRPMRRRSRASRRTPITLLNTDTSNFRAMVQQFTGGPSSSFASRPEYSNGLTGRWKSLVALSTMVAQPTCHRQPVVAASTNEKADMHNNYMPNSVCTSTTFPVLSRCVSRNLLYCCRCWVGRGFKKCLAANLGSHFLDLQPA
ncbi:VQ motif-containing protein motif-containing protein 22-like [Forsythia ovata]|uniref:VQ motif-containing protein motif-containing protein 22-like n=1 Tax=Forsythia ovata TaxID=205694 RepID=A0ABD1P331_9LAMI